MGRVKKAHSLGKSAHKYKYYESTQSKYSRHHKTIHNLISQTPTTRLGSFPKKVIIQGFNCAQIYLEQKETHGAGFGSVYSTAAQHAHFR